MPYPRQCPARRGGPGRQEKMTVVATYPRLHQDIPGTAAARPGPRTLAADRQPADPPPRELQLRRRGPDRRDHAQTVPAALCRPGQPVAVRDLPRQPRRLRRIGLLHRPASRHLPRRPRHRLRPLPQRPHRLDPTPDELTGETTKPPTRRSPSFRRRSAATSATELGRLQLGPVVRAVITMLCTWGCGRPCGPRWWSKEAVTQRWGLTGENLLRPVSCRNLSAA